MVATPPVLVAAFGAAGLLVGSFLNVVIHRVPAGVSLLRPRSACPSCGHVVRGYDNVPVVSWLALRGRCRDCAAAIHWRYPVVEAVTGLLAPTTSGGNVVTDTVSGVTETAGGLVGGLTGGR